MRVAVELLTFQQTFPVRFAGAAIVTHSFQELSRRNSVKFGKGIDQSSMLPGVFWVSDMLTQTRLR